MNAVRAAFLARRGAAVLIQRRFREYIKTGGRKRREAAALAIQRCWRRFAQRGRYGCSGKAAAAHKEDGQVATKAG